MSTGSSTSTAKRVSREVYKVGKELAAWESIRKQIENIDGLDEATLLDTLEGETELHEAIAAVGENILELQAQEIGLKAMIDDMAARKKRISNTIEKLRTTIAAAMDTAGIDTVKHPAFTFSLTRNAPGPAIVDETLIPAKYWKRADPALDRTALRKDFNNGVQIPGVGADNGSISLTMTRK